MKLVRPIDKRDQDVGVDEDSHLRRRGAPAANPLAECLGKCTTIVSVETRDAVPKSPTSITGAVG